MGEDAHEKMKSKFDVPLLKSFELVSSISTHFDDYIQKMKFYKDSYIDQVNTTSKDDKKIYLKKDEKIYELNIDIEDQWQKGSILLRKFSESSDPLR